MQAENIVTTGGVDDCDVAPVTCKSVFCNFDCNTINQNTFHSQKKKSELFIKRTHRFPACTETRETAQSCVMGETVMSGFTAC